MVGPAKLPAAEVRRVHEAFVKRFESLDVVESMARHGNVIQPTTPDEAAKSFRSEAARDAALAKKANVSLD